MNAKLAITFILGLVFQLAQVLPGAVIQSPCQPQQESCACCMGAKSCHCAGNPDSDQKPAPVPFQAGSVLKVPAAKTTETKVSVDFASVTGPSAVIGSPLETGSVRGFVGVRLSVAFCSFVI